MLVTQCVCAGWVTLLFMAIGQGPILIGVCFFAHFGQPESQLPLLACMWVHTLRRTWKESEGWALHTTSVTYLYNQLHQLHVRAARKHTAVAKVNV